MLELRRKGINRYEIYAILKPVLKSHTPAPSTIYAITKRHGLNRLTKPMRQSKRRIIKTRAGELGHLDSHYLSKDLIVGARQRYFLVSVLDSGTPRMPSLSRNSAPQPVLCLFHQRQQLTAVVSSVSNVRRSDEEPVALGLGWINRRDHRLGIVSSLDPVPSLHPHR